MRAFVTNLFHSFDSHLKKINMNESNLIASYQIVNTSDYKISDAGIFV